MNEARDSQTHRAQPHVIIVGGGFGGLAAARALKAAPVRVILLDRMNHHLFQPLLYQVATAGLAPSDIAAPIRQVLRKQRNATVALLEVTRVDADARRVFFSYLDGAERSFPYDYLILATGVQQSYFGHDEFAPFAPARPRPGHSTTSIKGILSIMKSANTLQKMTVVPFRSGSIACVTAAPGPRIEARLVRVRLGNLGDYGPVGEGVQELRIFYGPGYRVYFGFESNTIVVLLGGGPKSSQRRDIATAKAYWHDYRSRDDG